MAEDIDELSSGEIPTRPLAFPRQNRITRRPQLERLRLKGKRFRTPSIEVRALASPQQCLRVGFIVPKYGQNSVSRNRLKRRLREITRIELLPHLQSMDIVLRVTPAAYRRTFAELGTEILQLKTILAGVTLSPVSET